MDASGENKQYLPGLHEDSREGERTAFSQDLIQEIMLLQDVWEIRESIPEEVTS